MIPVSNTMTVESTLPGEEIQFGIGDTSWVLRQMADLYSDITLAIIREYSTNAYDSHVMAGNKSPIQVTLPSTLNPVFVVEDFGVGMDMETFRKVYTQFGVSNKRHSNDLNGQLGMGSKSGVAYTDSFQVTSVKDGIETHGLIQRKPDWSIVMKVVSTRKTTAPNGTKITIPVHNVDEFVTKANNFYRFWQPGRVLVNGVAPEHAVGDEIAPNLYRSLEHDYSGSSYVVMGNVPYRINNPAALFDHSKLNMFHFVAYVDSLEMEDGAAPIEFTPSREDLKYTARTKATLSHIISDLAAEVAHRAQKEIDQSTTHQEAFKAWRKWAGILSSSHSDLSFKGDKFVDTFRINGKVVHKGTYGNSSYSIGTWQASSMEKTMVITDFYINMSSRVKERAQEYAKQEGWDITTFLFTIQSEADIVSKWAPRDKFISWDDLKAALPAKQTKPRVKPNTPARLQGSWDYFHGNYRHAAQPFPTEGRVFYVSAQYARANKGVINEVATILGLNDDYILVVPANRMDKLLREETSLIDFCEYAKSKVVKDGASLLSEEGRIFESFDMWSRQLIPRLDVTKLDDPWFEKAKNAYLNGRELVKDYNNNGRLARLLNMEVRLLGRDDALNSRYPYMRGATEHDYWYANAWYNENHKDKE